MMKMLIKLDEDRIKVNTNLPIYGGRLTKNLTSTIALERCNPEAVCCIPEIRITIILPVWGFPTCR